MATIAEVFALAVQHHRAGNLRQAEDLYRQILQVDPRHADAHHMLGVCAHQSGRHQEAEASILRALGLAPVAVGFMCNLGLVYQALGKTKEAAECYLKVLSLQPQSAEAHGVLGNLLRVLGKHDEAVAHGRQALALEPGFVGAHNNLGLALGDQGKWEEAALHYREAIRLDPNYLTAYGNLGHALLTLGKPQEAGLYFTQALRLKPTSAEAHNGLGNALRSQGRVLEAIPYIREALRLKPDYAEAHNNLAIALLHQGNKAVAEAHYLQALRLRPEYAEAHNNLGALLGETHPEEASQHCREAIRLKPDFADGYNNLGNALLRLGKVDEAIGCIRQAIQLRPTFAEAHNNLGAAIKEQGQIEEGLASLQEALRLRPDYPEARWNRSLIWLLRGDFERGWPEYEFRWKRPGFTWRTLPQPQWDGSPLNGKSILLWAEQGLGDTVQFIRYARLVKERGGKVIFECQPQLTSLLAGVEGIERLVPRGSPLPAFEVHAPLLSLPGIFRTNADTIPATVPYLKADGKLVEHWRGELASIPGFKVGIAWQGNPEFISDRQRSMPLECFGRLAQIEGVQLVSLQKGPGTKQLESIGTKFSVIDFGTRLDETSSPFMDTTALLENLDLVISSDTAVPHLAGALGRPAWVALALVPDWRWQLRREDSPWYPTLRLFRQAKLHDWPDVFERLAEALKEKVKRKK